MRSKRAGYGTWLHGEAVAAGMVLAAKLPLAGLCLARSRRRSGDRRAQATTRARSRSERYLTDGPRQEGVGGRRLIHPAEGNRRSVRHGSTARRGLNHVLERAVGACLTPRCGLRGRAEARRARAPPGARHTAAVSTSAIATGSSTRPRSGASEYKTQVFVNHEGDHFPHAAHPQPGGRADRALDRAQLGLQRGPDGSDRPGARPRPHPFGHAGQDALNAA